MRSTTPYRFFLTLALFAALAAVPAGPARGQWVEANGPNGGSIISITVSGSNIYAEGGWNRGSVFLSTDTGSTWKPFILSGNVVQSIAGCGVFLLAETRNSIYTSRDCGATWTEASGLVDSSASFATSLVQSGSTLFAAVGDIFRSTDSGITWSWVNYGYSTGLVVIGSDIFEASANGIFRSSDNGETWIPPKDTIDIYSIATIGTILFVANDDYPVLRSTDSGVNWSSVGLYDYIASLAVEGTVIYATGDNAAGANGYYVSKDSGNSWTPIHLGNSEASSIAALGETIFVGTLGGLFRSSNSGLNGGLVGLPCVEPVNFFGSGNNLLVYDADYFGMLDISTDEGVSWSHPEKWTQAQEFCPFDSTIFIDWSASNDSGFSQESTDHGSTWISSSIPETANGLVRMGTYLFAPTASFTPQETNIDVFRSADEGQTWTVVCTKVQPQVYGTLAVLNGNRLIYAGSSDDEHYACYESDDFGESWQYVDSTSGLGNGPFLPKSICCLAPMIVGQMGTLLIGLDSGVLYRSSDDGTSWKLMSADSLNGSITDINSVAATGNTLFICAQNGNIFLSNDTGITWKNVNDGLVDSNISFLAVTDQYLFAANANDSFWRRPLSDFGISSVAQTSVAAQPSIQSFPNPFKRSTTISFSCEVAGYAEVSIVNALGAEVARLYSGELDAGNHSFAWDAAGTADGNYWCVVRMSGQIQRIGLSVVR